MNTAYISLIIFFALILIAGAICYAMRKKISFSVTGLDSGFKHSEISLLWKLAKRTKMEDPSALFWSVNALDRNISFFVSESKKNGTLSTQEIQNFLAKLYAYRTKIYLDPLKHKGLSDTRKVLPGQEIVVLMKAKNGVHLSKVIKVGRDIEIALPVYKKTGKPLFPAEIWKNQAISIYFMRKDDAAYVVETSVIGVGISGVGDTLHVAHSDRLVRTQKRKSVRAECQIPAQLYIARNGIEDLKGISTQPGLKCLIEDISEDGALIRIGGHGVKNLIVKIQFSINESLIVMSGNVRGVEYNTEKNQSLLHLEAISLDQNMKNAILGFVYNVLPDDEKNKMEAVQTVIENDENENMSEKEFSAEQEVITKTENQADKSDNDSIEELEAVIE